MKLFGMVLLALGIGAVAGWGLTAWEFHGVRENFVTGMPNVDHVPATAQAGSPTGLPRAVVPQPIFELGPRVRYASITHKYVVKNEGDAPLELLKPVVSCQICVHPEFSGATVPPGKSVEIQVRYELRKPGPPFEEHAEIPTNDPSNPRITLKAKGTVVSVLKVEPAELTLGSIPSSETRGATFQLIAFQTDDLKVLEHSFSDASTAKFFNLTFEKQGAAELAAHQYAQDVLLGKLEIKSGLPVGPISQTIHIKTNSKTDAEMDVSVHGMVVSDISVIGGSGLRFEANNLSLGVVKSKDGVSATLHVMVKGPKRDEIKVTVAEVDPKEAIVATLGEPKRQGGGSVILIPLTIQIPPGTEPINRTGSPENPPGRIVLETTHPDAKKVSLTVRFTIQD